MAGCPATMAGYFLGNHEHFQLSGADSRVGMGSLLEEGCGTQKAAWTQGHLLLAFDRQGLALQNEVCR